jgi:aspartyl-tRNA(Asn)/glutamyl-tRNA(Gln) amidotransferase subunit A
MASSLDTIGPLTRTVEDAALVLQSIAGQDPMDGTTSPVPVPDYRAALRGDVKGLRIGVPKEYVIDGMSPEISQNLQQAIDVLRSQGAEIVEISLPHTKYALATYYVLCPSEVSSNMARYDGVRYGHTEPADALGEYYRRVRSKGFGQEVQRRIMVGTYALSAGYYDAYYKQAQRVRTLICRDFAEAFKTVDVIAAPVTPSPAFTVGAHENDPVAMYLEDAFMDGAVMAGIPALSVPSGFSSAGLPIGLQLMAKQWDETTLLRTAHAYEQQTQFWQKKPTLA